MGRFVPYLSEDAIEADAAALLAEYADARGVVITPPVPIEDIVEKHLKLRVDFGDLHQVLGVPQLGDEPDILGAIWVDRREIFIDQSLDPEDHPHHEGRYRFTLAHEGGGHWRLHRPYFANNPSQDSLFGEAAQPTVICRTSQARERVEWQADFYASCLLMPRPLVTAMWRERFGKDTPKIVRRHDRIRLPADADRALAATMRVFEQQRDDDVLNEYVRPFARRLQVSMDAMRIRLERIGLLHRDVPRQRSMAIGA